AIGYCNWLSEREGLKKAYDSQGNLLDKNGKRTTDITKVEGYRLPTEAEWEYAARGGQNSSKYKYSGSNTVGDVAWHDSNSGNKTHPVGGKKPNELGIYDISGNVWEWCHDWFEYYSSAAQTNPTGSSNGAGRVNRGGSWYSYAQSCRVASRYYLTPVNGASNIGFRVSRTVF
ncbi:MAG TPA: SUMF1/EgtB/PvdO family nonheme iron enzyme, partial [Thermotogota bacterium]|nr:SUMF1/EgtB/PvdO family nonheme iron enzyme [Thermotogota bacterium]